MKAEEYGKEHGRIIVMLHGANFVHSFGRQYPLAERYHLIVPHLMGFGDEADRVFDTETCVKELAGFIGGLCRKVLLVGFSLGAQLGFKLLSEHPALFDSAILVSPWLIKSEQAVAELTELNLKQLAALQKKWTCSLIGLMNGLPSAQRKEFVAQMQKVKPETIRACVDNGITFDSVPAFRDVPFPVVALAGAKEQPDVIASVRHMQEINPNCRCEIWDKAAHNIPPVFAKRFNELIAETAELCGSGEERPC